MYTSNIELDKVHIPRWSELPSVDLYLDQVVTLINSSLSSFLQPNSNSENDDENTIVTKTMINNYVKNNLLEPPVKKKYSKIQCAKILAICILKQVYSLSDIGYFIEISLQYGNIEDTYNYFCDLFEQALSCAYNKEDFIDKKDLKNNAIYLLKTVLLSCSYEIYSKTVIAESVKKRHKKK